jgi:hypothetical protein
MKAFAVLALAVIGIGSLCHAAFMQIQTGSLVNRAAEASRPSAPTSSVRDFRGVPACPASEPLQADPAAALKDQKRLLLLNQTLVAEARSLLRRALDERYADRYDTGISRDFSRDFYSPVRFRQDTDRLTEAELLMRQARATLLELQRFQRDAVLDNYRSLLQERGSSEAEIEAALDALEPVLARPRF